MQSTNSLLHCRPNIAKYWHPIKNGSISPETVWKGSGKVVWWFCDKGHEYKMAINMRAKSNCPCCSNRRVCDDNNLQTLAPEIAKQWHPTKNGGITPKDIIRNSRKTFWWICPKGHAYEMKPIYKQTTTCPYCIGKRVNKDNSLASIKPEIAKQWHPIKNGDTTPDQVTAHSNKFAWWICPRGHEFSSKVGSRKNPFSGCKECAYERHTSFPEQVIFFYIQKIFSDAINRYTFITAGNQSFEVDIFIPSLPLAIEYDGYYHHRKERASKRDQVKNQILSNEKIRLIRIREKKLTELKIENGLSIRLIKEGNNELNYVIEKILNFIKLNFNLSLDIKEKIKKLTINISRDELDIINNYFLIRKEQSLQNLFPDIAKEWNYNKNKDLIPDMFSSRSHTRVWWKCSKKQEHEWKAAISNRTSLGNGCPYCSHQIVTTETCLKKLHPHITSLWNFKLNKTLKPEDVFPGSSKKVWWTCKNNHDHLMAISKKVNDPDSCPYCSGKKACKENSLFANRPDIAKQWHATRNLPLTASDVTCGSNKKVWWTCSVNPQHEWDAPISKRTAGHGCPYCSGKRVNKTNSLAAIKPDLAEQWHPKKNRNLTTNDVTVMSNKNVWWQCIKDPTHVWSAVICSRSKPTCPYCLNKRVTKQNSLLTQEEVICREWDYNKNTKISPNQVVSGSGKKVWWKCEKGHQVLEPIRERVKRRECGVCKKISNP